MRHRVDARELWSKGSKLHQLVRITGDLISEGVNLHGLDEFIRCECLKDCAYYNQSSNADSITCGSGELDGKPLVYGGCNLCVVGQFTKSGDFIGELTKRLDESVMSNIANSDES